MSWLNGAPLDVLINNAALGSGSVLSYTTKNSFLQENTEGMVMVMEMEMKEMTFTNNSRHQTYS